ncbi:putative epoxide hydrolase [Macrophomina phaseolina]|uniref:Epoxide hydrolase n=1 Tax=Macrophomina phaseolina TaxID=35725 RepID=A0ABQ8G254_9PEZI|nr:putative epoxide hydrolase [Macrophomina phaseolina]
MTAQPPPKRPKALLFDIGGVCVVSPLQAILDYERANGIPVGWVNVAISAGAPSGAWQRIERGEIALDDAFFEEFARDLANPRIWPAYWARANGGGEEEKATAPPPPPRIDAKALFWEMMRVSRTPDPWMWPALGRLREVADKEGWLLLGALSNTVVFPEGVRDEGGRAFESGLNLGEGRAAADVRGMFDVFVSSAHVGLRKPDRRIYEMALRLLDEEARARGWEEGVGPGDVLFLDDIGQNLKAAKELGMKTLKVDLGKSWKAVKGLEEILKLKLLEGEVADGKARL